MTRGCKSILCFMIVILLIGCGKDNKANSAITNSAITNGAITNGAITNGEEISSYGPLKLVGNMFGAGDIAASEEGAYELSAPVGTRINILYSDINTRQQIYLCSRPECKHNDANCTSFIDIEKGGTPGMLYAGGKLCLVRQIAERDVNAGIEIMEPDGSNRKLLFELPPNESMPGAFYSDEKHLVFISSIISGGTSEYSALSSVEFDTGVVNEILALPNNERWSILGAVGNKIILLKEHQPSESGDDVEICYEAWVMDLDNPALDNCVFQWTSNEMDAVMHDGYLYGYDQQNIAFLKIDLLSNTTQAVEYDRNKQEPSFASLIAGTIDGKLLAAVDDGEEESGRLLIDFENNTTTKLALGTKGIKTYPVPIVARYENDLLVITEYREVPYVSYDLDGNPCDVTNCVSILALISKDDYYNSNPNYSFIQPLYS